MSAPDNSCSARLPVVSAHVNPRALSVSGDTLADPTQSRLGRVLLIAYNFPPDTVVGAQSCWQIARHWPAYGWDPVILTVRERYVEHVGPPPVGLERMRVIRTGVLPHPFSLYRAFKSFFAASTEAPSLPTRGASSHGALWDWMDAFLNTPDALTGWLPVAVVRGLWAVRKWHVTRLISSGPPWTNHLVGLVLARLTGLPWIAHFRDPWREELTRKVTSNFSLRVERTLERAVVTESAAVVCVTEPHATVMRETYPLLPGSKFVTITNGYDEAEWAHEDVVTPAGTAAFTVTYAGSFYDRRSPAPLFRAARRLVESGDIESGILRICLIGQCDTAEGRPTRDIARDHKLQDCLTTPGLLSRRDTHRHLRNSAVLLLLGEGLTLQIPGKTFEYLRAGRPILALTSEGALADLLRRTGGAWIVDPLDAAGIVAALREAYQAWRGGRLARTPDFRVVSTFDRQLLAGRFAALFNTVGGLSSTLNGGSV